MIEEFMQSKERVLLHWSFNGNCVVHPMTSNEDFSFRRVSTRMMVYMLHEHEIKTWAFMLDRGRDPGDGRPKILWPGQRISVVYWAYCPELKVFYYKPVEKFYSGTEWYEHYQY